ncbi:MAG TPA: DUF1178 family protein [Rhodospirillaceae bacterium]|nr:DUF1178 family protein [Rhodospirillaceae bacterium]
MIVYSVRCGNGHVFDEWFSNSTDYDVKASAGEVHCPDCGDSHISKAIMAPSIGKSSPAAPPPNCPVGGCGGGACSFANDF